MLRAGACSATLAAALADEPGLFGPYVDGWWRDPLRSRLRRVQPPLRRRHLVAIEPELLPEQQALLDDLVDGYLSMFEGETATVLRAAPCYEPTEVPKYGLILRGLVDLLLEDGPDLEVRLLSIGAAADPDPATNPAVALAIVRLVSTGVVGRGRRLRVRTVSLRDRRQVAATVDLGRHFAAIGNKVLGEVDGVRVRAKPRTPEVGGSCRWCHWVAGCRAVPGGPEAAGLDPAPVPAEASLVGPVLALSPSAVELWHRCPRAFRARHLLALPGSDRFDDGAVGVRVHRLLEDLHAHGPCTSGEEVRAFLAGRLRLGDPADAHVAELVQRHVPRCPQGATSAGHERTLVRVEASDWPLLVVTGRLDAMWVVGGALEVRDYKTGKGPPTPLALDPAAQVQAWLAAPLAESMGLDLRVRYELLSPESDDDLAPWSPADEDLDAIGARLRAIAVRLGDGREVDSCESPAVCDRCEYRTVCPVRALG